MARLIDADKFGMYLADVQLANRGCRADVCELLDDVMYALDEAPTIDAVGVVHGWWEKANNRPKSYIRVCSVCGKEAYFCGNGCSYKYCPNCGAKMDEERKEE